MSVYGNLPKLGILFEGFNNSQQHYGWVSVSDKDGGSDVWLIFAKMGNEPEMDRKFSGNGQMKGKMRWLLRKWTGNDSGHGGGNEPEMDRT